MSRYRYTVTSEKFETTNIKPKKLTNKYRNIIIPYYNLFSRIQKKVERIVDRDYHRTYCTNQSVSLYSNFRPAISTLLYFMVL